MNRSTYLLCILVTTTVLFVLTTPVLAGPMPTPTPATATPATATPATPTPDPNTCAGTNSVVTINTDAKGQSPSVNPMISHAITGNIINPGSLSSTAHRIPVCAGTSISAAVTGPATTTSLSGTLFCNLGGCAGVIDAKKQYKSTSTGTSDRDSITFLPQ